MQKTVHDALMMHWGRKGFNNAILALHVQFFVTYIPSPCSHREGLQYQPFSLLPLLFQGFKTTTKCPSLVDRHQLKLRSEEQKKNTWLCLA